MQKQVPLAIDQFVEMGKFSKMVVMPISDLDSQS